MRAQYRMRNKVAASIAAAAMAASMVVAVPGAAFATYDSGSITAKTSKVTTYVGAQIEMENYFNWNASGGDGEWHIDYRVIDGSAATVNKHSGVLTAASEGDVVVKAYLDPKATPTGNKNNPCFETDEEYTATVTVHVDKASAYGYQGNKLGIKMTSPTVTDYSGSNTEGWTNIATGATATDGYYLYTISMNNGFKNYGTTLDFAIINAGNIALEGSDGTQAAVLKSDNSGSVVIKAVDVDAKTITVGVLATEVVKGDMLVFKSAFRGNNAQNTLGTSVSFVIK